MHINNDFQRNSNISNVFETMWRNPDLSRVGISRKLDLYRSTVSNLINALMENNLIFEGERGTVTEKGGRKPVFLTINQKFGFILGIELQPDYYNVSAINFTGKHIFDLGGITPFDESKKNNPSEEFTSIVDKIIETIISKVNDVGIPLLGICIAIPGIVDIDKGIVIRSDAFGIENYKFSDILGNRYGLPLFMENDAKCCAWLQCANNKNIIQQDFLCVLAINHNEDKNNPNNVNYKKGIGVGLSFAMNGRIVNGHNYAVGEYISRSWDETKSGQTGLSDEILEKITSDDKAYECWLEDLFATLTPTIALLEPCVVYLHGQPKAKYDIINNVISRNVKQFAEIIERCGSKFVIADEDAYEISKGAAYMFIQKLFEIPSLQFSNSYSHLYWDTIFEIQKKGLNQLHTA